MASSQHGALTISVPWRLTPLEGVELPPEAKGVEPPEVPTIAIGLARILGLKLHDLKELGHLQGDLLSSTAMCFLNSLQQLHARRTACF